MQEWQLSLCLSSPRSGAAPEGEGVVPNGKTETPKHQKADPYTPSEKHVEWGILLLAK